MTTQQSSQEGPQSIHLGLSSIFDYDELLDATGFFNPAAVIGQGGFGVVYRGELRDGRAVAIKELIVRHKDLVHQFVNEINLSSKIRHKNLVALYGRTDPKDGKMFLVYEFMPNGTVADHLHHRRFSEKALTWSERLHIAIETAKGLAYLHSLQPPVIHCDVKTDNILLDNNFNVKVADFGFSRLLPPSGTHLSTMPQGTQGYLDPEYNQLYKLTTKSDVYSFGVVLMELISGKAVLDYKNRDDDEIWLVRMALNKMKNGQLDELVDLELGYLEHTKIFSSVNSVAQLAYECLQPTGYTRRPMLKVLESLKKVLESLKKISDDGTSTSSSYKNWLLKMVSQEGSFETELPEEKEIMTTQEGPAQASQEGPPELFDLVMSSIFGSNYKILLDNKVLESLKKISNDAASTSSSYKNWLLKMVSQEGSFETELPEEEEEEIWAGNMAFQEGPPEPFDRVFSSIFGYNYKILLDNKVLKSLKKIDDDRTSTSSSYKNWLPKMVSQEGSFETELPEEEKIMASQEGPPELFDLIMSCIFGSNYNILLDNKVLESLKKRNDAASTSSSYKNLLLKMVSHEGSFETELPREEEIYLVICSIFGSNNYKIWLHNMASQEGPPEPSDLGLISISDCKEEIRPVNMAPPEGHSEAIELGLISISDCDEEFWPVNMSSQEGQSELIDLGLSSIFDHKELQEATNFFHPSEVVGKGGFGVVYRGKLRDGRAVAIKSLINVCRQEHIQQFLREVRLVSGLRHNNLVSFYGSTDTKYKKMLLVYEFMPNGTVADHLHGRRFSKGALTWSQRLQIAIQTAEAIAYLHSLQPAIIHGDVKTNNILLDNNFNVKVADFSTSCLVPSYEAHISATTEGTEGYLDPEYNQLHKLTTKTDVYNFGVVLVELISGKAVADIQRDDDDIWLIRTALKKMKNDQLDQLVDSDLGYSKDPNIFSTINYVAELAYECLQPGGHRRPPMVEVFKSLKEISNDDASTSSGGDDEICLVNVTSQRPSEPINLGRSSIFNYDELEEATKFFNPAEVVGQGGFGVVYRGKLKDGRAVAIKELTVRHKKHKKRVEQFFNEVRLLAQLCHKNLVRFYGCTNPEYGKMLLVYEFMPNGTVADHLHRRRSLKKALTWSQRLQIAIETAEGIAYLHSFQPPVVHCDVKTNNILLDDNFNVKVADFGMSRLLPQSSAHISGISCLLPPSGVHISTMPQGTQGYLDPEYNQLYKLSTKSDVYSFGVVLLELISGKAVLDVKRDDDEIWLVRMAFNKMKNDQLEQLVDPELGYLKDPKIASKVNSMAQLAYECLQPTGYTRPPMVEVLKTLKEISDDGASTSSGGGGDDNAETSSSGFETFTRRLSL